MKSYRITSCCLKDEDEIITIYGDETCITIKMDSWGFNDLHLINYTRKSVQQFLALWGRNQAGVWNQAQASVEIAKIISYLRYRRYRDDF